MIGLADQIIPLSSSKAINISPEMIDLRKKVKVFVNGKEYVSIKIDYDREFMIRNFEKTHDRAQVWVNQINIKLD